MNGKKGSMDINIPCAITKVMKQHDIEANGVEKSTKKVEEEEGEGEGEGEGFSLRDWMWRVWEFTKEDSNRVKFAFKVGLAVLLVSLLILFRAPYDVFGNSIIWSILTVAIMFEYTVGATFNRGFNRALGSLLAGVLAISVAQVALRSGRVAEPIIIGISIFIVGAVTSFMKQWPSMVPYEYGFRVILFTYCLIVVSGYRMSMGNPMRTAMDRLYSIAIGGFVAVFVNVLVCPIWAGEQLHKELVNNFKSVADSLEECVRKYLADDGTEHTEFSKTVMDEFPDEPAYRKCRSTLNSSAKIESLETVGDALKKIVVLIDLHASKYKAVSAKWEPPHGRFRHFFYPWSEYVKVAAVLRYCAYEVMALHGVVHSEIQAPYNLRITFQSEIREASSQAAELVRSLGQDISNMKRTTMTSLLKRVHSSTEKLQRTIDIHSYLLTSSFDPPDSSNFSKPLSKLAQTLSNTSSDLQNQLQAVQLDRSISVEKRQSTQQQTAEPYYHELMRKQSRRLHYSWPPRQVDAFEEEGSAGSDFLPRMKALESTAALSLATFTSLLIEFVARLDHLVEAVDELSKLAKF